MQVTAILVILHCTKVKKHDLFCSNVFFVKIQMPMIHPPAQKMKNHHTDAPRRAKAADKLSLSLVLVTLASRFPKICLFLKAIAF